MKTSLPTPSSNSPTPIKKDPSHRLTLAVKKLDQLISRAHQLGAFTDHLLREENTGPSLRPSTVPSTQSDPALPAQKPENKTPRPTRE